MTGLGGGLWDGDGVRRRGIVALVWFQLALETNLSCGSEVSRRRRILDGAIRRSAWLKWVWGCGGAGCGVLLGLSIQVHVLIRECTVY